MLGKLLQGRYQVIQVLTAGGFGQTYLAQDTHRPGHPTCVVKHLKATSSHTLSLQDLRWLFTREVEALKKLGTHDQVPQLLAHFEDKQEFYLVQEFIEGHSLSAELPLGSRWTESQVIQLLQEVLGILEFIHSHVLIYRDLKPSNLIRRQQDGRLVLIDFGSVQQAWTQVVKFQGKTRTNVAIGIASALGIGTPGYMPTEQEQGRPRFNSDIYALGMIGIRALTGLKPTQLPKDPNTGEFVWQHQAQVSTALACVLNKMVRYDFKDRYESATEVLQALLPLTNLYPPTQKSAPSPRSGTVTLEPQTQKEGIVKQPLAGSPRPVAVTLGPQRSARGSSGGVLPQAQTPPSRQGTSPKAERLQVRVKLEPQRSAGGSPLASSQAQAPLSRHDTNQFEGEALAPLLGAQISDSTVSIFPHKSALLIGLIIGITSGLILMVVSYYSLQISAPAPKIQKSQVST